MPDKMKTIYLKYREPVLYIFFGGLTTLVNVAIYAALAGFPENFPFFGQYTPLLAGAYANTVSTAIAWIVSVVFAYITNKIWVFESKTRSFSALFREFFLFFAARIFSGFLDIAVMFFAVDVANLNNLAVKIVSNVLVIVLNYFFSKLLVFRKKRMSQ